MSVEKRYADVLLPLRLRGLLSYAVSSEDSCEVGSWVMVKVSGKLQTGVVTAIRDSIPEGLSEDRVLCVEKVLEYPPASACELQFWQKLAEYYMCTPGEVFSAACNKQFLSSLGKSNQKHHSFKQTSEPVLNTLSDEQKLACEAAERAFGRRKNVLLRGVTGSGKTEVYMHLAARQLAAGRNVLYMVPEIAVSQQLEDRIRAVFGNILLVYHSKVTPARRKKVVDLLRQNAGPFIILGTRSAILLPLTNIGLIVVDEEHDRSYKQDDPAPRYHGRDAALMYASIAGASVLLGSATPSCESLYNAETGKYELVELKTRYYESADPEITVIDTLREYRLHNMKGSLSRRVLNEIGKTVSAGDQVLVFRSRRAYSPIVQCSECGAVPKCPHCNVSLSYHKFSQTLSCHYCGYSRPFTLRCLECGETALVDKGAGTEKIEEELAENFPDLTVRRFDADTASGQKAQEEIIQGFERGDIDILVGTQMISKGFDFSRLALVVVVGADSLFSLQDFRSDEYAMQLLSQIAGRAGRRKKAGRIFIQTAQPEHPVLTGRDAEFLLEERKMFAYPPFVRMVKLTLKDRYEGRLANVGRLVAEAVSAAGVKGFAGPVKPAVDRQAGENIVEFWIKLPRSNKAAAIKKELYQKVMDILSDFKGRTYAAFDVDPM